MSVYVRLAGPGQVGAPLGGDDAFVLERAQDAVQIADVDAVLAQQRRKPLQQLVAVRRALGEEKQQRGLAEALDAGLTSQPEWCGGGGGLSLSVGRACLLSYVAHI